MVGLDLVVFLDRLKGLVSGPFSWQRVGSLALVGLGWLLSPLCWWNDLLFNLPLAVALAKLVELWNPNGFMPALVVGYWLSNVLGGAYQERSPLGVLRSAPRE